MTAITATEARSKLYRLIDEAAESHKPIRGPVEEPTNLTSLLERPNNNQF